MHRKGTLAAFVLLMIAAPVYAATFKGYQCVGDCSGHIAGYKWARKKNITDPQVCIDSMVRSRSFGEGCMAWVEGR